MSLVEGKRCKFVSNHYSDRHILFSGEEAGIRFMPWRYRRKR